MTRSAQLMGRWLAACLALVLAKPCAGTAQGATRLHLVPVPATVGVGQTTTVQARIENVANLYAFQIQLKFDPAVVEVVDADSQSEGLQVRPGDLLKPDFVVRNLADNAEGTVWLVLTQISPSEAVTGSGVVFTVTFRGKRAGASSALYFSDQMLVARTGDVILASVEQGEIRVLEAQQAPPTPTAAPTLPPPTMAVPTQPPATAVPTTAPSATPLLSATVVPPTVAPTMTTAPPKTTLTTAATARPTAVTPTSVPAAATSALPATPVQVERATAPTSREPVATSTPAARTSGALLLWLIVYTALFAVAFAVAILVLRVRPKK